MTRIIDLTSKYGVYATRLLAECGHDVIRVEPRSGDAVRRMPPFLGNVVDLEHGAYHQFFNANKRSFSAALNTEAGQDLFSDFVRCADAIVLCESAPVDAKVIAAANPRAVVVSIEEQEDSDLLAAARSGLLSLVGYPDGMPLLLGGQVENCAIGLYAAVATGAALHHQNNTGAGQTIRVSARSALEAMMEQSVITFSSEGRIIKRRGFRGEITAASSAFAAADGFWMLSVIAAGKVWDDFVDWVQDPELSADPSLADEAQRHAKRELIAARLDAWSLRHPKAELIAEAQRRHIPASPVATVLEICEDEQLIARGYLLEEQRAEAAPVRVPRGAIATPRGASYRRAPTLGQHNGEILAELGYSAAEHEMLMSVGAL